MWGQQRKLINGTHPKTNAPLPVPRNLDGTLWDGGNVQAELQGETATTDGPVRDDGFYTYVPAKFTKINAGNAVPSQSTFSEILSRVRHKGANQGAVESDDT